MDNAKLRAVNLRDDALERASTLFKKFEVGEVSDDEFLNALVDLLKTQTVCNELWISRYIEALEDSAHAPLDRVARWEIAAAGTALLIDSCVEGLERKRGKRIKGPHRIEAARSLVLRLEKIYERATGHRATISTPNPLSRHDTNKLSGPYPEYLRQAEDKIFKKIAADSGCRWPASLPGLAKEIRRKPRKASRLK
jgi:hypothetical protein